MKRSLLIMIIALLAYGSGNAWAAEHRIGAGVTYWTALDDIDVADINDDGFSYLVSYQYWLGLIGFEADLELLPDRFGETAIAPQAFILVGRGIYGGAGIGIENRDGDFADEPFFAFRAGVNLELLPGIYGDVYGTYRFNDSADLDQSDTDVDTDTIFLGAMVRVAF